MDHSIFCSLTSSFILQIFLLFFFNWLCTPYPFPPLSQFKSFNHDLNYNLGKKNVQVKASPSLSDLHVRIFETCYWSISCSDKRIMRSNSNPPVAAQGTGRVLLHASCEQTPSLTATLETQRCTHVALNMLH